MWIDERNGEQGIYRKNGLEVKEKRHLVEK
jgi:hypothetical protein